MRVTEKVKINWVDVEYFKECGHGVELHYHNTEEFDLKKTPDKQTLVAFVVGFKWWHGTSNVAEVRVLKSKASKFVKLGINGDQVRAEVMKAIEKYVSARKPFPDPKMDPNIKVFNTPVSEHLSVWVNG
jgi:hypothetical protein